MTGRARRRAWGLLVAAIGAAALGAAGPAPAQEPAILERLTPAQQRVYVAEREARRAYEAELAAYWRDVTQKREARREKRAAGVAFVASDYVMTQPPVYRGPTLPPDIARIVAAATPPTPPPEPLPGVATFLADAKALYGFVPERISEVEFKRRYATETLAAGLTKEQVLRVYALETGGNGTADMQSGINPLTKAGTPISSALGYAQLLHANSVGELATHGPDFLRRLRVMATKPGTPPARAAALRKKIGSLSKMIAAVRRVPNIWAQHVKLGGQPQGRGIHALNLDGDIGPWLQAVKLAGIKKTAADAGRDKLTGAELELMNLAGPRTGLEMMDPAGRAAPTTNFFTRDAYARNSVVRERTSAELLVELDRRMDFALTKPGAIEFAQAFDAVMKRR